MQIGLAAMADAEALREVHVETWAATFADLVPARFREERLAAHRRRDWRALLAELAQAGGGVMTARDDRGALIGFCQFGATPDEDDDADEVGHIDRLYVLPRRQRGGVGGALVDRTLTELRGRGWKATTLWALEADARAVAFYEKTGWIADGARRFDGGGERRYRRRL
jgi:GNAT superfamily N-acetyltransferase